jgi:thioredoxin reductase
MTMCNIAIIGAGPYGLSIAAHLRAQGVDFRIFGSPMQTWRTQMPKGMRLKSEGFASSLDDPQSAFTLAEYCRQQGLPYADLGLPVPLETFTAYGLEFQKRYVPGLEDKLVVSICPAPEGYEVTLDDGEVFTARRAVLAVGITHFAYVPSVLAALPQEFVTHSSRHHVLDQFKGREVAVVGAGASAVDLAALLHAAGASVQLIARKPVVRFHDPAQIPRPLMDRIQTPMTGIGPGWKLVFCTRAPLLFRQLPETYRLDAVRRILGPAPGWFVKQQVVGKVPFNLGLNITEAEVRNGQVSLQLTGSDGAHRDLVADHVIAATGYRVDLRRLGFLDPALQAGIRAVEHTPVLSSNFESSVPGLYFVGVAAANTFGPLLRFAYGARFTARRLSKHLADSANKSSANEWLPKSETHDREEVLSH